MLPCERNVSGQFPAKVRHFGKDWMKEEHVGKSQSKKHRHPRGSEKYHPTDTVLKSIKKEKAEQKHKEELWRKMMKQHEEEWNTHGKKGAPKVSTKQKQDDIAKQLGPYIALFGAEILFSDDFQPVLAMKFLVESEFQGQGPPRTWGCDSPRKK